jgi:hypothetical protein
MVLGNCNKGCTYLPTKEQVVARLLDPLNVKLTPGQLSMQQEQFLSDISHAVENHSIFEVLAFGFVLSPVSSLAGRVAVVNDRCVAFENRRSSACAAYKSGRLLAVCALHR